MRALVCVLASVMLLTAATGVEADPLRINAAFGSWESWSGAANAAPMMGMKNRGGPAMDTLRWGAGRRQSGYDFDPTNGTMTPASGDSFVLGTLTHINNPIAVGTELEAAEYSFGFGVNGDPSAWSTSFMFDHNETLNRCNTRANPHCSDDIVGVRARNLREKFSIGGEWWYFTLLGFSQDGGHTFGLDLRSPEGGSTSAALYGQVQRFMIPPPPPPVPEPAAFALLGFGVVVVALQRARH